MQKLVWQNAGGVELDLTSGNYGITEWEGFSNASLNIQSQQVPFQDGGVFLDALIEQRELSVTLAMQDNNNLELRYQQRRELISALNPKLGEGYLIYTNDFISKRIKCVAQIPLFETHNSDTVGTPKASLSWTACEPYWEDLEETEVMLFNDRQIISNNGDVPCQVKLKIVNTLKNKMLINNITNKKEILFKQRTESLDGNMEYEEIEVDTNFGKKRAEQINKNQNLVSWNNQLNKVVYVEDLKKFLVVGNNSEILTFDGKNWDFVPPYSFAPDNLYAIACSSVSTHKRIFIVGIAGGIVSDIDKFPSWEGWGGGENIYRGVCYNRDGDYFVAVGENGIVAKVNNNTDTFPEEPTFSDNITTKTFFDVEIVDDYIVAVGEDGIIFTSNNGTSWTQLQTSPTTEDIKGIRYVDDFVFLLTETKLYLSENAMYTWEEYKDFGSDTVLSGYLPTDEEGGRFIIGFNNKIAFPVEGNVWQDISMINNYLIKSIAYSWELGIYVFVGEQGARVINASNIPQEETWEDNTNEISGNVLGITESEQNIFAVTESGNIYRSDRTDINKLENVSVGSSIEGLQDITYSKKLKMLVAVGFGGTTVKEYLMTSDNEGESWVRRTEGASQLRSVAYSEDLELFVVVGDSGIVKTSSDGINWTTQNTTGHSLVSVISAKSKFFAVGSDGYILSSENGITWTVEGSFSGALKDIAYSQHYDSFVAVGDVYIKKIGEANWQEWSTRHYNAVAFSKDINVFRLAGTRRIETSINGSQIYWSKNKLPNASINTIYCAFYSDLLKQFIYGGADGVLFNEKEGERENIIERIADESNMGFNLEVGENIVNVNSFGGSDTTTTKLSYRQKYIGV